MADGETRRPTPSEITPLDAEQAPVPGDVLDELDHAEQVIAEGSLHAQWRQLGREIRSMRLRIAERENETTRQLRELDALQRNFRRGFVEITSFQSRSAEDWELFRERMVELQKDLRRRLERIIETRPES